MLRLFQNLSKQKASNTVGYKEFCQKIAPIKSSGVLDENKFIHFMTDFYDTALIVPSAQINEPTDIYKDKFIIGEYHHYISSKKFLQDEMKRLKKEKYDILFMEHLFYDTHQVLLDEFYQTGIMPEKLRDHLEWLNDHGQVHVFGTDSQFSQQRWKKYNFLTLVESAREAGIRIVGIDIDAVYKTQNNGSDGEKKRIPYMNYVAFRIIEREMAIHGDIKWFALMGNAHVVYYHGVPGLSNLTGVLSVFKVDSGEEYRKPLESYQFSEQKIYELFSIKTNTTYNPRHDCSRAENVTFNADILIHTHPDQSVHMEDKKAWQLYPVSEQKKTPNGLPLLIAASSDDVNEADNLLKAGANANQYLNTGVTPLLAAAAKGHTDMAKLLLEYKANIEGAKVRSGVTPLYTAVLNGHQEMVALLGKSGANVNCARNGITPLYIAILNDDLDMVVTLLSLGANPNVTSRNMAPLYLAIANQQIKMVEALIQFGANPNLDKDTLLSGILSVLRNGKDDIVKLLLCNDQLDVSVIQNSELLYHAASYGHQSLVNILLEKGASPNGIYESESILMVAAENGHIDIVKKLLDHEADPRFIIQVGKEAKDSVIARAKMNNHEKIVELLEESISKHVSFKK